MISTDPHDLAASMLRIYGDANALSLASGYANDASASGDRHGHKKWAAVVIAIAAMIEVTLND